MSTSIQLPEGLNVGEMSIAVISPHDRHRREVVDAVASCQNGHVREFVAYPSALGDVPRMLRQNFDVFVIDLDSDPEYALDLVESIGAQCAATVMAYSAHADSELLLRCMRAGAREFLTLPLAASTMAEALVRASALRPTAPQRKTSNGELLVFLSAKGGSGVTTLACNLAVSLAQEAGKKTLLIDLNLPLGDAAINLGIRPQYSTVSALQNANRLDAMFLLSLLERHSSGMYVLAAPSELAQVQFTDEAIDRLLKVARQEFDYVVVDAGSRLDLQHTNLFSESAAIYLVTQVGIAELRNSNRVIAKLAVNGGPKLEIVLNRFDPRNLEIDEEHITKALTRQARWKVPNDYPAVRRMQNTATPFALDNSPIARSIQQISRAVCGRPEIQEQQRGFNFLRWRVSRA